MSQKTLSKIYVRCPHSLVQSAWAKLTESTGWAADKSMELKNEFFRLTAERAGKKQPGVKFPENFVFTRSYKTHVGRFMVVAHFTPIYTDDSVTLTLTQFGAYFKIWESEKITSGSTGDSDLYNQDGEIA